MNITYESPFDSVNIIADSGERFTLSNSNYIDGGKDGQIFKLDDRFAVKMYTDNPIKSDMREKLMTLCYQRGGFHELVVSPIQLVRIEGQSSSQASGFIMKYLPDAKALNHIRWKSSIPEHEVLVFDQMVANFIYKISEALESLHNNRVFVCDLKPQNILISNSEPYLIDFDSCSMPNYPGESFTVQYLDPRIRDKVPDAVGPNEEFSALTDWWALAVIAFELFMGVSPWTGIRSDLRKDPLVFRSYLYSCVYLDPKVVPPRFEIRDSQWLESKPKLKTYFKNIFSPNPYSRVPMYNVLDAYFPRDVISQETDRANALISKLIQDSRQRQFIDPVWNEIIDKARRKGSEREKARIRLLDMMYSS